MKSRQLALIGTVLALSSLSVPFIISETSPKTENLKTPNLKLMGELVELGCTEPAINHVFRYSNLLDDSFDGTFFIDLIGLPENLSQVEFDKCVIIILEERTSERDTKLDSGYKLYPGVGWIHPDDQGNQQSIYRENPDNPGELVLDIDAMQQVQRIFDHCDFQKKLESGEIPARNPDGSWNIVDAIGLPYQNSTHYIDNNICEWQKIK